MTDPNLKMSRDFARNRKAWIGGVTLAGASALTILPERIWGQYADADASNADER